jgi:AcrR family transcriptional regulator
MRKLMEQRRRAVLTAARKVLVNGEAPSMRQLADAAGVAHATPYNLFGNKRGLYVALNQDLQDDLLARVSAKPTIDALDRMYEAIRLLSHSLEAQAALHRAIFAAIYTSATERSEIGNAAAFWDAMIPPLAAAGIIQPGVDMTAFTRNFVYLLSGILIEWADARIDTRDAETAIRYGFTLAALGVATPAARPRLQAALKKI